MENAVSLCDADKAFIFRFDGEALRMAAAHNASPELKEFRHGIRTVRVGRAVRRVPPSCARRYTSRTFRPIPSTRTAIPS